MIDFRTKTGTVPRVPRAGRKWGLYRGGLYAPLRGTVPFFGKRGRLVDVSPLARVSVCSVDQYRIQGEAP